MVGALALGDSMSNPLPLRQLRGPIVDKNGHPTQDFLRWLTLSVEGKLGPAIDTKGQVQATTKIAGRTEQIGVTVQNINATGQLKSLTNVAADVNTDHVADGTGSPLTGGKRAAVALDVNNRLAGSFRANAVNVSATPTSSTVLSNDGISHAIVIAASTAQFGDGTVSYSSGSVDPGVFGTFYIFADDPTFAGGAVTYQFSASPVDQTGGNGRVLFGKIITVGGSAKTGGGSSGGTTPGGSGGRGFIQG